MAFPQGSSAAVEIIDQAVLGARLQPGRDLRHARSIRRTSQIDPKATIKRPSGARTPFTRGRHGRDARARGPQCRRHLPRVGRPPAAGNGPRDRSATQGTRSDDPNDLVPHEHRRELRALRVFGAWTNLVDWKAGNTLDTLVEENGRADRQALPAGRRLVAGHGEQRARMGHGLGVLLRRPGDEEALPSPSASPSAHGRPFRTSNIRRSTSSKAIASIRRPGSRRHRSPPTSRCAPTMRSGRRGG